MHAAEYRSQRPKCIFIWFQSQREVRDGVTLWRRAPVSLDLALLGVFRNTEEASCKIWSKRVSVTTVWMRRGN